MFGFIMTYFQRRYWQEKAMKLLGSGKIGEWNEAVWNYKSKHGGKMPPIDLRGMTLKKKDLRGARLQGADFRGAKLSGTMVNKEDITGANIKGQRMTFNVFE